MIPNTDSALRMLSQRLMMQLLPDIKSEYNLSDGMLLSMLMMAVADEVATGIDTRMKDIAEMKGLLEQGRGYHDAGNLISAEPDSFSLKDVNQLHDDLTRHLIELHARVETAGTSEASQLVGDIWSYLEACTARHAITSLG
jgi:hypothetical protein|tara:strand:+ start:2379 stop:2801 length:423 start_codon:yes stop_codon:yes gene_type:complete